MLLKLILVVILYFIIRNVIRGHFFLKKIKKTMNNPPYGSQNTGNKPYGDNIVDAEYTVLNDDEK